MIKRCTSAHDADWLALRLALWPQDSAEEHIDEMERFCAQPGRYGQFVEIADSGEPRGLVEVALRSDYVNGTNSSPVAFVEGVYVEPACRGHGIARFLMAEAEQWAMERGCTELASDALLDNVASHAMHLSLGFQETERVVFFRRDLAAPHKTEKNDGKNKESCD